MNDEMFKEIVTALISVMIIAATLYNVIAQDQQNGVLVGLSGAVVAFYLTRGAVQTGQNGTSNVAQKTADIIHTSVVPPTVPPILPPIVPPQKDQ